MSILLSVFLFLGTPDALAKKEPVPCQVDQNKNGDLEDCDGDKKRSKPRTGEQKTAEVYKTDCSQCSAEEESCDHCH